MGHSLMVLSPLGPKKLTSIIQICFQLYTNQKKKKKSHCEQHGYSVNLFSATITGLISKSRFLASLKYSNNEIDTSTYGLVSTEVPQAENRCDKVCKIDSKVSKLNKLKNLSLCTSVCVIQRQQVTLPLKRLIFLTLILQIQLIMRC